MNSIHALMISNLVFAALLAVLAAMLTRLWRNPQFAHALWLLVLVKLVTPPVIHLPLPQFSAAGQVAEPNSHVACRNNSSVETKDGKATDTRATDTKANDTGISKSGRSPLEGQSRPIQSESGKSSELETAASPASGLATSTLALRQFVLLNWSLCLLFLAGSGTLLLTWVAFCRHRRLLRVLAETKTPDATLIEDARQISGQMGLASCPPVRITDALVCPLVSIGIWKQLVLLPEHLMGELSRDQIRSVLAHELAHIRRRDHWVRCFELAVLALFWWNPVAWWASRRLRQAEEECCDAWVIWALPESRRSYGLALLRTVEILTERPSVPVISGAQFGKHLFLSRIEMIMKRKTRHRMPWTGRVAILLLAIAVIPLAAVMTSRAEPKKTGRITRVTTSNQKAIIEVHGDETVEIVLQIAKSKRNKKKLEWTLGWSAAYRGPVTASISLSDKIKLNNKKTGRGIVYRLGTPFGYSQANIAMTEKDPLPIGTVRFRGKKATSGQASIQRKGDSVVFADIKQKDGKLVPISLLVRKKSSPRPSKRAVTARIEALGGKVHSSADFVIEISLFKTKATDRDLATIPVFDKLIGLGLAGTRVTDAGLAHIQNMTSLGSVDLNHTGISDDGLVFLKKLGKLSYLHLANTKVTDNGLVHVKQLKNMAFLNLNNTKVTNLGLVHLRKLTKLYTLILNGTRITDQGLVHLRKLPSMLDIRLSKTAVGDIGLEQLKDMSKLRTVVLTGTKVSGSGLRHLPTSVKTLWLPSTKVDDAGLRHLSHLKQLKSLVLSGTQVTDKGLVHLMKLKQLRTLSLHGTKVTNAGVERVKAALPACQVGR